MAGFNKPEKIGNSIRRFSADIKFLGSDKKCRGALLQKRFAIEWRGIHPTTDRSRESLLGEFREGLITEFPSRANPPCLGNGKSSEDCF